MWLGWGRRSLPCHSLSRSCYGPTDTDCEQCFDSAQDDDDATTTPFAADKIYRDQFRNLSGGRPLVVGRTATELTGGGGAKDITTVLGPACGTRVVWRHKTAPIACKRNQSLRRRRRREICRRPSSAAPRSRTKPTDQVQAAAAAATSAALHGETRPRRQRCISDPANPRR